jgi:hypothetical protein
VDGTTAFASGAVFCLFSAFSFFTSASNRAIFSSSVSAKPWLAVNAKAETRAQSATSLPILAVGVFLAIMLCVLCVCFGCCVPWNCTVNCELPVMPNLVAPIRCPRFAARG